MIYHYIPFSKSELLSTKYRLLPIQKILDKAHSSLNSYVQI